MCLALDFDRCWVKIFHLKCCRWNTSSMEGKWRMRLLWVNLILQSPERFINDLGRWKLGSLCVMDRTRAGQQESQAWGADRIWCSPFHNHIFTFSLFTLTFFTFIFHFHFSMLTFPLSPFHFHFFTFACTFSLFHFHFLTLTFSVQPEKTLLIICNDHLCKGWRLDKSPASLQFPLRRPNVRDHVVWRARWRRHGCLIQ